MNNIRRRAELPADYFARMARPKRFELLTPRFVVWCSIQLSYGRVSLGLCGLNSPANPKVWKAAKEAL
jgi:hypothetical protein